MKLSTTIIFSALFVTVTGFYVALNPRSERPVPLSHLASVRLVTLEGGDQIDWIQIQNIERKETITLILQGDRWMLKYPVFYPADPLIANGLVTALTLSAVNRRLLPEGNWEEYGLLIPSKKVGIQTKQDKKRRYLYLGQRSPVGDYIYAKWEGAEDYFLLDANLERAFDRSLYSIRQKQIFRTPVGDISRIHVKTSSRELEFAREDGEWAWVNPPTAAEQSPETAAEQSSQTAEVSGRPVSKERVDELLMQFRDLFVKDFLDTEKKDRGEYGITDEGIAVKVWGASAAEQSSQMAAEQSSQMAAEQSSQMAAEQSSQMAAPEIFYLGREVPAKDAFYGTRAGENVIFLVARDNVRMLFEMLETAAEQSSQTAADEAVAG